MARGVAQGGAQTVQCRAQPMIKVDESVLFPEGIARFFTGDDFARMFEEQEQEQEGLFLKPDETPALAKLTRTLDNLVAETQAHLPSNESRELELVVLSTCNRTEIYTSVPIQAHYLDRWFRRIAESLSSNEALYHLRGESAAQHLFRVLPNLDGRGTVACAKQSKFFFFYFRHGREIVFAEVETLQRSTL